MANTEELTEEQKRLQEEAKRREESAANAAGTGATRPGNNNAGSGSPARGMAPWIDNEPNFSNPIAPPQAQGIDPQAMDRGAAPILRPELQGEKPAFKTPEPDPTPSAIKPQAPGMELPGLQGEAPTEVNTQRAAVDPFEEKLRSDEQLRAIYQMNPEEARRIFDLQTNGYASTVDEWKKEKAAAEADEMPKWKTGLISALSMIGALGNVATATSSRNGRAVATPDLAKAADVHNENARKRKLAAIEKLAVLDKQQRDEKTAALERLYKRKEAADKLEETRRYNNERLELDRMKADNQRQRDQDNLDLKKATLENQQRITDERVKNLRAQRAKIQHDINGGTKDKDHVYITGAGSNAEYKIPKSKWNKESAGTCWRLIKEAGLDKVALDALKRNGEVPAASGSYGDDGASGNGGNATLTPAQIETAIGIVIDDVNAGPLREYLKKLEGGKGGEEQPIRRSTKGSGQQSGGNGGSGGNNRRHA